MRMMMGQLQHAQGRRWKLRVNHETQNVKLVIFRHISSHDDYLPIPLPHQPSVCVNAKRRPGPKTRVGAYRTRPLWAGGKPTDATAQNRPRQSAAPAPYGAAPCRASNAAGRPRPRCGAAPYSESPSSSSVRAGCAPPPPGRGREPPRPRPSRRRRAAEYRPPPHPQPYRAA